MTVSNLTKDEIATRRAALRDRAAAADLRLPDAIREARDSLGVTPEVFGSFVGMTAQEIADIENGVTDPTLSTLSKIGSLFGWDVAFVPRVRPEPPEPQDWSERLHLLGASGIVDWSKE